MQSGMKVRLARLEAAAPERPSPFDDMTADELRTWIPDEAERLLICEDISEEHRAWLKQILVAQASGDRGGLTRVVIPRDLLGQASLF
jgi:hypothetical protein